MGDAQSLPVIGETVTVIESGVKIAAAGYLGAVGGIIKAIDGEDNPALDAAGKLAEGAGKSWVEYSEKNCIVGTSIAIGYGIAGKEKEANRRIAKIGGALEGVVDSTPVVGHVKGAIHYATGDETHGDKCMLGASRSTAVFAVGMVTGGLGAGAVAGGFAGVGTGVVYDGTVSVVDIETHNDDSRTHGVFKTIDELVETGDPNRLIDIGLSVAGDFAAGASAANAGEQLGKALEVKRQRNALTKAIEKKQRGLPKNRKVDANSATNDAINAGRDIKQLTDSKVIKGDGHVSTVVRDLETNDTHQGYSQRARQDINVHEFEIKRKNSGFNSKTNAKKCGIKKTSELQKRNPDVQPSENLNRRQTACAEHDAFDKAYQQNPSLNSTRAQVVSVQIRGGIVSTILRCENCCQYARAMGNVVTDLVAGRHVPLELIAPYITEACQCGALAIAIKNEGIKIC